jgi:hypothetical protein
MLLIRLAGVLLLLSVLGCLVLYLLSRDRRYLRWATRLLVFAVATVLLVAGFYAAERLLVAL